MIVIVILILFYGKTIILYKPIGRDKWLNIRPYKLTEKYHRDEIDKNNREFTEKIFMWCEIIIDKGNPNRS